MLTIPAFIVALGLLIAVHEYGHYRVAVACGVRVLRFSLGFGKVLVRWTPRVQKPNQQTEFVISAFPLGGYVRMLDEREGPVDPAERHLSFNAQPLSRRAAIVAAGPAANLLLAIFLYAVVNWMGVNEPRAVLAAPIAGSIAERAGLRGGEEVLAAAIAGEDWEEVRSFETLRWQLTRAALDGQSVRLRLLEGVGQDPAGIGGRTKPKELDLALDLIGSRHADAQLMRHVGLVAPYTEPLIGELLPDSVAARQGLRAGDRVLRIGSQPVVDGVQLRELIRASVQGAQGRLQVWTLQRPGQVEPLLLEVTPQPVQEGSLWVGRIGAYVGAPAATVLVRYGPLDGLWQGARRAWEVSALTLGMMGKMLVGEASIRNLSGPITIADYAGKSASLGLTSYLVFLALISVSLGVLNLLPLPVLDGGHLLYYLWEGLTGREVSERWLEVLQRTGVGVLLLMTGVALFNDISRLFG